MLKSFFKDTIIYGVASILPRIINLAMVAIFTMVLGKADFSDQTTWYVYAAFINVILTMGIETSFFRFYTSETDKNKVLTTSSVILLVTSGLFLIIGLLAGGYATTFLGFSDHRFIQILVIITVLDTLAVIPFAYLRVTGRPLRYMIIKIANVTVLFLVTAFLLLVVPGIHSDENVFLNFLGIHRGFKPGVIHIIIANLIASSTTLLIIAPELLKIKWKVDRAILLKLLHYGWPIMVGGIAFTINENLDKLLIQKLIDKESNGVYAACYKLGVFMTLYITAFRLGAEPFFFKHSHQENAKEKYSTIMTWFVIFGCIFLVFVTVFVDQLAGIIIKNEIYLEGLYIVPVILLANLFSGIYANLSIWYKLTDKTRFGMYISIWGAVITIVSLYMFVPAFGIMGGAVATLFTYFVMTVISWFLGRLHYPVLYETGKILFFISVATVFCTLSFIMFRGNLLVNIGIFILFLFLVLFVEKKEIENAFKKENI